MILIWTCRYLCVLFAVATAAATLFSGIGGERSFCATVVVVSLSCALGLGLLTRELKRRFKSKPDSIIFRSKALSGICIATAAVLTLFLIGEIFG